MSFSIPLRGTDIFVPTALDVSHGSVLSIFVPIYKSFLICTSLSRFSFASTDIGTYMELWKSNQRAAHATHERERMVPGLGCRRRRVRRGVGHAMDLLLKRRKRAEEAGHVAGSAAVGR